MLPAPNSARLPAPSRLEVPKSDPRPFPGGVRALGLRARWEILGKVGLRSAPEQELGASLCRQRGAMQPSPPERSVICIALGGS